MKYRWLIPVLLMISFQSLYSKDDLGTKQIEAKRTSVAPKIDGVLDEEVWETAQTITDFIQLSPTEGVAPSQVTKVKIVYDDQAIYVGAFMVDTQPDSIQTELGERDNMGLNADVFHFRVDPYNTHQDAYVFGVSASGVQQDLRFSDFTYNGVWESKVSITEGGWIAEMKIPYSAIRFPNTQVQTWSVQFTRYLNRKDEFIQWSLTPKGKPESQNYWGSITGIKNIKSPVRLSVTPYLSSYWQRSPVYNVDGTTQSGNTYSYNAGTDLKYGIDDRFTLDVTLLPDFGQVQSDDQIKNLSYNEVTFEENRPFFSEGVDLFNRNGLFYSRRIGQAPSGSNNITLVEGEYISSNPAQSKLLNATKISGRTNKGLGLGFFNAITKSTFATVADSSGTTRSVMTEPLTNYNVLVVDKQFKNNANVFLMNTNVLRSGSFQDADVTSTGFRMYNKKKTINIWGDVALSRLSGPAGTEEPEENGFKYSVGIRKATGAFRIGHVHSVINDTYDASDMGYWTTTNIIRENLWMNYFLFNPWKMFRRAHVNINTNYTANYLTKQRGELVFNLNTNATFHNLFNAWGGMGAAPIGQGDFYEPRVDGKFFDRPGFLWYFFGLRTDNRKKLTFTVGGHRGIWLDTFNFDNQKTYGFGLDLGVSYRANDKLSFSYTYKHNLDHYNIGFASIITNDSILFAGRAVETMINEFTARYSVSSTMWITLDSRHYWSTGKNRDLYLLQDNGSLATTTGDAAAYNFSFNAFTVDMAYTWWFAPGSTLSLVYKNVLQNESADIINSYTRNFGEMMDSPQTNIISLKALYYLDYLYVKKRRQSKL